MASSSKPACKYLVLDSGPLISLSPLRGLAETYVTVPQVLDELKDKRAREHFEQLALTAGVNIKVISPDAAAFAHVVQFAKKTGDYSVLSHPDLAVIALTYALDLQDKAEAEKRVGSGASETEVVEELALAEETEASSDGATKELDVDSSLEEDEVNAQEQSEDLEESSEDLETREPLNVELQQIPREDETPLEATTPAAADPPADEDDSIFDDPSEEDDGEGEWITPSNVSLHKSKALGFTLSDADSKTSAAKETLPVACTTTDFAMQNVLLQMGLTLMGVEGKRIEKVKTWVLRCHACFKICKDNSKKFCPACGGPSLIRTSVTISSPKANSTNTPTMQVHLKKNFQYRTRGTIYSIPAPKPGSAKTGSGQGLILREDQVEYQRAVMRADAKRARDEKKMFASGGGAGAMGSWMDPDWVPDIIAASASGKGRRVRDDMPVIGHGRRNPNERKHRKK